MISNTRLYGAAIAFASGFYSIWSAAMMSQLALSRWIMAIIGVVVIAHGAVLLTDFAARLGNASGLLMIIYAVVMLLNQVLMGTGMMADVAGMGMDGGGMMAGMGWDAGMVALAALMLFSGIMMTRPNNSNTTMDSM